MSEQAHDKAMLAGVGVCGMAVAAYSSWAQFNIADACGYPTGLAWVVPVATDATAALGTRAWMSPHYGDGVRSYGRFLAILAIALSIMTAALHLVVPTDHPIPWQIRLAIGGLPSLALAALVHLGALTAQDPRRIKTSANKQTRRPTSPQAGTAMHAPVPVPQPRSVTDQVATTDNATKLSTSVRTSTQKKTANSRRTQMYAYLDQHPEATGADLDAAFDTTNYGRRVRRDWETRRGGLHLVEQVSGR
jgi:hypothetical protein